MVRQVDRFTANGDVSSTACMHNEKKRIEKKNKDANKNENKNKNNGQW